MKLLFNRISSTVSGAEIYNIYLLKELRKYRGLDITFVSNNKDLNKRLENFGINVFFIDPSTPEIGTKKQFLHALLRSYIYYFRYLKFFKKIGKQDIYIFESMTEKIALTIFLALLGRKIIWIEHGPVFNSKVASVIKFLYKFNSNFVNKIICVSKSTEIDLINQKINREKTITCYIGIDTDNFIPLSNNQIHNTKSSLNWRNKKIVGFLGTLNKEKGIEDYLKVSTKICEEEKDIRFLIVGGGILLDKIKAQVKDRNLTTRIFFTNYVNDIKKWTGIMDVLLFPTYHQEGLSISLLEANALGIPIVATDIGGNREIVFHGENGFLFKNTSADNIKELIYKILKNNKVYKKNARTIAVSKFSINENSKNFYKLFHSLSHEK